METTPPTPEEQTLPEERSPYQDLSIREAFFELFDKMVGDVRLVDVLRHVAEVVCDLVQAERTTIYLIDPATDELESVATVGNVARIIRIPLNTQSLAGYCAASGRTFVVPDAYGDLSPVHPQLVFDRRWDEHNNFRTRDVMCAPALFKGHVLGVVQVINSRTRPFNDNDLVPLQTIARMVGYALHQAQVYEDLATLKQLEREKAEFMRILVHELKAPIAASKMMLDALQITYGDHNKLVTVADRVAHRLESLTEMIGDVLQLAQVKGGQALGEIAVVDFNDEVRACCDDYRPQALAKDLAFDTELCGSPLPVRIDRKGGRLAISNLINNAIKYTHSGNVIVRTRLTDNHAVFEVTDTGIGIPEAEIPNLFTEFFRASNAKRSQINGSGVGLAGLKDIVERFSGQLELESKENKGSTFRILFPLFHEREAVPA